MGGERAGVLEEGEGPNTGGVAGGVQGSWLTLELAVAVDAMGIHVVSSFFTSSTYSAFASSGEESLEATAFQASH